MRVVRWWWLGALLVGCPRKVEVVSEPPPPPSELGCPEGTFEMATPLSGMVELTCRKSDSVSVRHGPALIRRTDGQITERGAWADGLKTGHWWSWDSQGRLIRDGDWADGQPSGWWMEYATDGTVAAEGGMVAGKRSGLWVVRDETGEWEQGWVDGELHGTAVQRGPDGIVLRERVYVKGRLVSQRELR